MVLLTFKNAVLDELFHLLRLSAREFRGVELAHHSLFFPDILLSDIGEEPVGVAPALVLFAVLKDVFAERVEVFAGDDDWLLED